MNKFIRYLIILIGLFLAPWFAHGFSSEMWPDEGRPIFHSKVDTLSLHEQPSATSIIKKHKIKKGNIIAFDETCYRTVKSGKIKVIKAVSLDGRNFGRSDYLTHTQYYSDDVPNIKLQFKEGDSIEYLQERAEGSCIIKWQDQVIELEYCPWFDEQNKDYQIINNPVNEWWIRVIINKEPIGWLLITNIIVDEDRKF